MPRVEVLVRVIFDNKEPASGARFTIQPNLVNRLYRELTPENLARYFGEIFRQGASNCPIAQVVPAVSEDAVSNLRSWPVERRQRTAETVRRQLAAGPLLPGVGMVDLPESMSVVDRMDHFAQALRGTRQDFSVEYQGRFAPGEVDANQVIPESLLREAQRSPPPAPRSIDPQAVQELMNLHREYPTSVLPRPEQVDAIRQAFGLSSMASAGIEPTQTGRFPRRRTTNPQVEGRTARPSSSPKTPKEPEDRSRIPTRYHRKPVI
jgi:hypothetical protein